MSDTEITILKDGPIRVQGEFVIKDPGGNPYDLSGRKAVSLCRCGHSKDKPFCDGSHRTAGFQSAVVAKALPSPKA